MTSSARLLLSVPALIFTGLVLPAACANSVPSLGGSGGSDAAGAGGGGSSATGTGGGATGTGGGMTGPCTFAEDCVGVSDSCNVGTCINGTCQKMPANESAPCDDGKQCTTGDHCESGLCTGPLKACNAATPCHLGMCDIATDACIEVPGNDGAGCVDDDPCTLTAVCQSGSCVGAQQVDCSFLSSECGIGSCDPAVGCVAQPINDGTSCDDGLFCTVSDSCTGGTCVGLPNTCTANNSGCMIGSCNEASNTCTSVPAANGIACDDGSSCTSGEKCTNGTCGSGVAGNAGGACDDGDGCTQASTCDAAGNCIGSNPVLQCANGDLCCPAGCDSGTDDDCIPPTSFDVLASANVTYQGINYVVLKVGFLSDQSVAANWCYEYQNLCTSYGGVPTGCGQMYTGMNNGYGFCKTMYGSDGTSDSLGCNPSGGVSAAAQQAGFNDASFDNSFGFHYCDAGTCSKTMCAGQFCNTALSYIDITKAHGYTLCKL